MRTARSHRWIALVVAVVAQATLAIGLNGTPASASGSATITYEHPGSSCVGDHDILSWGAQDVPGLLGYQVEQWVGAGPPGLAASVQLGPDQLSWRFVAGGGSGVGNVLYVKTITASGINSTPFVSATVPTLVPPAGTWLQFQPAVSSVGKHTATIVFGRNNQDKALDEATRIDMTASPADGTPTVLDGIGFTTRFDHLHNGTPYTFTVVGTNACGTGEPSYPSYMSVVPGLIHITSPSTLSSAAVGAPYSETLKGTGGCTDSVRCSAVHLQWSVTSGSTPPGMNFGGGRLVGVPTTAGTFSFTVTASAACACLSDRPTKTFTLQVGPAGAPALVSSANPSVSGQPVSLTLTAPSGATVNFFDGSRLLGTKTSAYGKALLRGVKLSPGSHAISATFTPKLSSDWPVPGFVQQVDPAPTATTLIAKPITQVHARMVTLTAHVKRLAPATGPVAAGTVSLYDNETLLVTLPVANGSVTFKTNALATGTHPMTAVFNGSSDEQSSSTAAIDVVIV